MNWNALIIDIVMVVLVPLFGIAVKYVAAYLKEKTDNSVLDKYVVLAEEAVTQAVEYVAQTYVDALKKAGEFDEAAQQQAFEEAKKRALDILGEEAVGMLGSIFGDFNTWLETKIEQHCRELKQNPVEEGNSEAA